MQTRLSANQSVLTILVFFLNKKMKVLQPQTLKLRKYLGRVLSAKPVLTYCNGVSCKLVV